MSSVIALTTWLKEFHSFSKLQLRTELPGGQNAVFVLMVILDNWRVLYKTQSYILSVTVVAHFVASPGDLVFKHDRVFPQNPSDQ